jgi:hypothetical protein
MSPDTSFDEMDICPWCWHYVSAVSGGIVSVSNEALMVAALRRIATILDEMRR